MTVTPGLSTEDNSVCADETNCHQGLALRHLDLVHQTARYYTLRLRGVVPSEDIFGAGLLGLMRACTRHPECNETEFRYYAQVCIRGAIQDELRKLDTMPRGTRKKMASAAVDSLELAKLQSLHAQRAQFFSLEGLHSRSDADGPDAGWSFLDRLSDDAQEPGWKTATEKEDLGHLHRAMDRLTEEEKQIIHWVYFENLTMQEVGHLLGISASYACHCKNRIMERLRGWFFSARKAA